LAWEVGHVEAGHYVGGWQGDAADVIFDLGFAVEVVDVFEVALCCCYVLLVRRTVN
jgi:hypothetical protein